MKKLSLIAVAAAAILLAGCAPQLDAITVPSAGNTPAEASQPLKVQPDAGRALQDAAATGTETTAPAGGSASESIFAIAGKMSFGVSRRDPFSLLGQEIAFDREQTAARILAESGGFREDFVPQPEIEEGEVMEAVEVPDWRVAGIVISDSVLALIDTGRGVYDVRPGQTVPESEWVVISIDEDSVLLRHKRNVTPKEYRVLLSSQLMNPTQGVGGAGFGNGAGYNPGGVGPGGPGGPGYGNGRNDRGGDAE